MKGEFGSVLMGENKYVEINLCQCHVCSPLLPYGLARDQASDKADKAINEGFTGIDGVFVVLFPLFRGEVMQHHGQPGRLVYRLLIDTGMPFELRLNLKRPSIPVETEPGTA
jgi:hypothetical protein